MRKVSRSMLAAIAALQSGGHSRRKPDYIREVALISGPYEYSHHEIVKLGFGIQSMVIKGPTQANLDSTAFVLYSVEDAALYEPKVRFSMGDFATVSYGLGGSAVLYDPLVNLNFQDSVNVSFGVSNAILAEVIINKDVGETVFVSYSVGDFLLGE